MSNSSVFPNSASLVSRVPAKAPASGKRRDVTLAHAMSTPPGSPRAPFTPLLYMYVLYVAFAQGVCLQDGMAVGEKAGAGCGCMQTNKKGTGQGGDWGGPRLGHDYHDGWRRAGRHFSFLHSNEQ